MCFELKIKGKQAESFRFKRFYEPEGERIHIWGKCEVTGYFCEIFVPLNEFYTYLQGNKSISDALRGVPKDEREFLITGISPKRIRIYDEGRQY